MRIVIDLQGAQTESRFRGIGRYSLSLAKAMVRNRGDHEVIVALSDLFANTIEPIRAAFCGLLPEENIRAWHAPCPVRADQPGNTWRREAAERIREAFLASLLPDVLHVTSLFEGFIDDAVTSIGVLDQRTPTVVTLYDLIPLLNPEHYLRQDREFEQHYLRKVQHLKRACAWLAISCTTKREGIESLGLKEDRVFNISAACDECFK
jgi:glycosyltransferase involved in cell wall biosynthesis